MSKGYAADHLPTGVVSLGRQSNQNAFSAHDVKN